MEYSNLVEWQGRAVNLFPQTLVGSNGKALLSSQKSILACHHQFEFDKRIFGINLTVATVRNRTTK
jgi:hypothetical protein